MPRLRSNMTLCLLVVAGQISNQHNKRKSTTRQFCRWQISLVTHNNEHLVGTHTHKHIVLIAINSRLVDRLEALYQFDAVHQKTYNYMDIYYYVNA